MNNNVWVSDYALIDAVLLHDGLEEKEKISEKHENAKKCTSETKQNFKNIFEFQVPGIYFLEAYGKPLLWRHLRYRWLEQDNHSHEHWTT